jgi:tetratricopeptide (TPR) repeat protein
VIAVLSLLVWAFAARLVPAQEKADSNGVLRVAIPGKPGVFEINAPGFVVDANDLKPDGRRYLKAENPKTGVILSIFLERSEAPATLDDCRRSLLGRAERPEPANKTEVHFAVVDGLPVLEFLLPEALGQRVEQGNFFLCAAQGNLYADIHFSKVLYKAADRELFLAVVKTMHFSGTETAENVPPVPDAAPRMKELMTSMGQASFLYQQHKYKESIGPYEHALNLEKNDPSLDPVLLRVLVDNLGMAYGMTGDLKRAKETFEYGVARDNTYPMFHYNLACAYAEMKDLDKALPELALAYQYKQNMIAGETLPDPRTDDSFRRYLKDQRFLDFLKSVENKASAKTPSE